MGFVETRVEMMRQKGGALLEALIAGIVIGVGLLGIVRLQLLTVKQGYHANLSYQATLQAYDMADRMRANPSGVQAGLYNAIQGIPTGYPNCNGSVNCTPSQMASFDAGDWNTNNAALLPAGAGTVTGTGSGSNFTIQLQWTEATVGARTLNMTVRL